jgi:hypothetical protein
LCDLPIGRGVCACVTKCGVALVCCVRRLCVTPVCDPCV